MRDYKLSPGTWPYGFIVLFDALHAKGVLIIYRAAKNWHVLISSTCQVMKVFACQILENF